MFENNDLDREAPAEIVRQVMTDFLGMPVEIDLDSPGARAGFAARVNINGDWCGAVIVGATPAMVERITGAMFAGQDSRLPENQHDALREIGNIIAGNVKTLLASSARLAIPEYLEAYTLDAPCCVASSPRQRDAELWVGIEKAP